MRFTAAECGVSVAPASRNTASLALRALPLSREGSRPESLIVWRAGDASSQKPMPKKTPVIAAAISPTETGKSRMPTERPAALVRRLGVEISRATPGFPAWFRSFQNRRALIERET